MAAPKRKKSKAKTAMRKAQWYKKLNIPGISLCPECGQPKKPHRVCPHCGYYKDKEVVEVI
ncbi:50S ribosomal protein L32 [Hydrogenothermus marinus]|uniref:Large ribosomal subunit protein bL32 n=1 Tax=Hydrogenothermus marinus TaxID=133270 RepID=A0A3M0B7D3_9AQUI|nr:50S ribosomal protein L32 [Hydrogenothermus marinus]RMA93293.1 large subunit ribosomal protein L32 [Hydrogenothermus marinus]